MSSSLTDGEAPVLTSASQGQYDSEYVARLVVHLYSIVCLPRYKVRELPQEFVGIKNAREMNDMLWGIRELTMTLAKGDLEYVCKERGFTVGSLKSFQSNLRHLTWQAQRIAAGEYQHRVEFLGDFSVAFNHMAEQLAGRIKMLRYEAEEYKDMSYKDELTGVYNRKALSQFAEEFFSRRANPSGSIVLVLCDIDHFKKINDTYGHLCGDKVLCDFTNALTAMLRPSDFCFRYGGEEFLLVMPNTLLKQGLSVAERLCVAVERMYIEYDGHELQITASFGVTGGRPCDRDDEVEEHLTRCVRKADDNLYRAKESGRNCVIVDME